MSNTPAHPRDVIIESMARTLLVLSYMEWCDTWDDAQEREDAVRLRPPACVSARGGEDWFDIAPKGSTAFRAACAREAAVLYGRIYRAWGQEPSWCADPWLVLHWNKQTSDKALKEWGHCAIMSLVGHGVRWEDDRLTLESGEYGGPGKDKEYTVPCLNIDGMTWPGRTPPEEPS